MLRKEDFVEIQALAKAGVYQRDIAEQLGVHPKTISRALKRGSAPAGSRRQSWVKVRPFAETIRKTDTISGCQDRGAPHTA